MNNCGSCKYFGKPIVIWDEELCEEVATTFHKCLYIKHNERMEYDLDQPTEERAVVVDGSGYFAALVVKEDFGCVDWEKNDE